MPKRMVDVGRSVGGERDLSLDIVSYGRRGPGGKLRLGASQVEQIQRTVGRTAEVMVKVSGGGRDPGTVGAHLKYIGRHGKLPLHTDDGREVQGKSGTQALLEDWALDLCRGAHKAKPGEGQKDNRAKLVHNIVLSMPAGTPPEKVLAAARMFARENFALQHRYAMVLHTDQPHPHVHLVVKCEQEYEPNKRLYIRKATLRGWREQFAALMREQGVPANATPRQVRGQIRRPYRDPIHHRMRAMGAFARLSEEVRNRQAAPKSSSFMRKKVVDLMQGIARGEVPSSVGKEDLQATRDAVSTDWMETAQALRRQGSNDLAAQVERFVDKMAPVRTDAENLAQRLTPRDRGVPPPSRSRSDPERSR